MKAEYMIVPWEKARAQFRAVRANLSDHLDRFYGSIPEDRRAQLTVAVVEYSYGEKIVEDGWPYWPGEAEIPPEFIIAQGLPLGFILENSCEILEYSVGPVSVTQVSQAMLQAGEAIGLFEMTDALTEMPQPKAPDWHITAGATSIHALPNLGTQQNVNRLEKALNEHIDHFSFSDAPYLIDQLLSLRAMDTIRQGWRVRIVYFSRAWFDELMPRQYDEGAPSTLIRVMLRQAWKSTARVRNYQSNVLYERLRIVRGGGTRTQMAAAAAALLTGTENVLAGRRPCYVPMRSDGPAGPFGAISQEIIGAATSENWVLAPCYLEADVRVGYLKLEHVAPPILDAGTSKGMKDKVTEMMSILRSAAQKEANAKRAKFEIASYVRLLDRMMFQTPNTRAGSTDNGPSVYRIMLDERFSNVKSLPMTPKEFYAPLFSTLPNERCPFFRNAVRLEAAPEPSV